MKTYVLLFSGHMIDTEDREVPRFPKEKEAGVRREIKNVIVGILDGLSDNGRNPKEGIPVLGIAGGACGGDMLFHEVCRELGIATKVLLALPAKPFIEASVEHAGESWVKRFYALESDPNAEFFVMPEDLELPESLVGPGEQLGLWQRNNLWILNTALESALGGISFIALWDRKEADGPGGTEHMIREVEKKGAQAIIINPLKIN